MSLFRSALSQSSKFFQRLRGERSVGFDLHGNEYLVQQSKHDIKPRRSIKYKDGVLGDADSVPMAWHAWLKGHREQPPTMEELQQDVIDQAKLQRKIKELKIADDKLRMQELSERSHGGVSGDMSAQDMIRQLEGELEQEKKLKRRAPISRE